jgi:hypothetical protein
MSGDMKIKAEFKQLPTSDSHNQRQPQLFWVQPCEFFRTPDEFFYQ